MSIVLNGTTGITTPDVTSDGLTVDSTTLVVDETNNRVGIDTNSPDGKLHINGTSTTVTGLVLEANEAGDCRSIDFHNSDGNKRLGFVYDNSNIKLSVADRSENKLFTIEESTGNVGIDKDSPTEKLDVNGTIQGTFITSTGNIYATSGIFRSSDGSAASPSIQPGVDSDTGFFRPTTNTIGFSTAGSERVRIDASGNVMFRTTNATPATSNVEGHTIGITAEFSRSGSNPVDINRVVDGALIIFRGQGTSEGTISVSGTTVSYNGGHLARWAQTLTPKDESLLKGTVLSNLDEMNVYLDADGNPVDNEQLNKVKVSDVEGDANVAGVFVNWDYDKQHNVDEINMAMTGDMIIRIAAGTTVARGDLLMSAGDGTAKPQGDDIIRSKTVAKVTSNHVTCTYADGSYCVPCVLMAC